MKTTVAVTVALVLAALTAHAAESSNGIFVGEISYVEPQFAQDPLIETARELQARIQAAQEQLSRYPDWFLLFGAGSTTSAARSSAGSTRSRPRRRRSIPSPSAPSARHARSAISISAAKSIGARGTRH